jgi:large subunit ribosomal protein L32
MRSTKSHRNNRRSHHGVKPLSLIICDNCDEKKQPHTVCAACGQYKGRDVLKKTATIEKKLQTSSEKEENTNDPESKKVEEKKQ